MSTLCEPLEELTDEILVISSDKAFHAPAPDGGTHCGTPAGHRRELEHAPLRTRPCRHCFAEKVVEQYQKD
jgi:hypothetical protein